MTDHHKNICKFFKDQSKYVWSRIEFARQMNIRVSETSITEELLYRFYKAFWETDIPVRLFESVDENKNGSDIEILVNTNRGYILLACQAKITYKSSKYKSFYHKVKEVPQIDLLRDYAKRTGGVAQYLLYNFIPGGKMSKEVKILADIESYGITQVSADEIIEWMKEFDDAGTKPGVPGFNQFHPDKAFPFHELICSLLENDEPFEDFFPATRTDSLTYYSEADVADAEKWRAVTTLGQIGYVEETYTTVNQFSEISDLQGSREETPPIFSPKFRLVIGGDKPKGAVYSIE